MRLLNIIDQALWFRLRDLAIPLSKSEVQIIVILFRNVNGRISADYADYSDFFPKEVLLKLLLK